MPSKKPKTSASVNKKASPAPKKTKSPTKVSNKKSSFNIYLILLIVVVIAGASVWFLNKSDKKSDQTAQSTTSKSSLTLVSSASSVAVGDKVHVQVYSNSNDIKNNAVQAVIKFPSKNLQLVKINSDASAYPVKAIEKSTTDTATISRGVIGGVINKQLVTDMEFIAKESGDAEISYDKSQSFLVSADTNKNLLNNDGFGTTNIEVIK